MALCDGCQKFKNRFFDSEPVQKKIRITIHKNFAELSGCADTSCDLCRFIRRELCYSKSLKGKGYDLSNKGFQTNDKNVNVNIYSSSFIEGGDGNIENRYLVFSFGKQSGFYSFIPDINDDRNNSSGPQIRPADPSLDQLLKMSRQWLANCRTKHKNCDPQTRNEPVFHPTRLLDVQQQGQQSIRLVLSKHLPQTRRNDYLTLSYCWGEAHNAACTTKDNFAERLEAIPITSLPKTLRDAVEVTRAFGVRYLWVDALCIIQTNTGENEDWQRELPNMGKIYKHSLFTIAASGAKDSSVGCFHRREAARWPVEDYHLFDENRPCGPDNPVVLSATLPKWSLAVENSALAKRGWVLQERMLASRTLFWTEDGLFWECGESNASEYLAEHPRETFKYPNMVDLVESFKGNGYEPQAWLKVLTTFSEKALTVLTDKVPAIAGLGSELSRLTGRVFEMGIFKHNLVRELAWSAEFHSMSKTPLVPPAARLPGTPSWSWASTNNRLEFNPHPWAPGYEELATDASVNAHQLRIRGRLGSLRVKSALGYPLKDDPASCKFVPVRAEPDEEEDDPASCKFVPVRAEPDEDMHIEEVAVLDTLADTLPEEGGTIRCIQWLRWEDYYNLRRHTGALIISPVDEERNIYRRIGWLQVGDDNFFEEDFRDIILV